MFSSDVMVRINSSASSGLSAGPSMRCKMPCTRITGGEFTRMCKSDAPSATTNCSKSDIEYDIEKLPLRFVAGRRADDLLGRRHAGEHLADAVLAQRAHAHLTGARAQDGRRHLVVNQFPRLVVNDENFKNAEAPAVAGVRAVGAAAAFHERGGF